MSTLWELKNSSEHYKSNKLYNLRKYYRHQFDKCGIMYQKYVNDPLKIYRNGQRVAIINWNNEGTVIYI